MPSKFSTEMGEPLRKQKQLYIYIYIYIYIPQWKLWVLKQNVISCDLSDFHVTGKFKIMVGSSGGKIIVNSGKWPCGVYWKGVLAISVQCTLCTVCKSEFTGGVVMMNVMTCGW